MTGGSMTTSEVAAAAKSQDDLPVAPAGIVWTRSSLTVVDPNMTYEQLEAVVGRIRGARDATAWWMGDILLFTESRWGEQYAQMMDATGLSYSRLTTIVSTCKSVEVERRRDDLSFSHHEDVMGLKPKDQEEWLAAAAESSWSRGQLRDALREGGALPKREPKTPAQQAAAASSKQAADTVDAARHLTVVGETLELVQKALAGEVEDPQQAVLDLAQQLPVAQQALEDAWEPLRMIATASAFAWPPVAHDVVKEATVSGDFVMVPVDVFQSFRDQVTAKEEK